MKNKLKSILSSTNGSTLFENLVAIAIMGTLSLMMLSSFVAAFQRDTVTATEYIRVTNAYHQIEDTTRTDADLTLDYAVASSKMVFSYSTGAQAADGSDIYDDIKIDGTFIYDSEEYKIGEFRP